MGQDRSWEFLFSFEFWKFSFGTERHVKNASFHCVSRYNLTGERWIKLNIFSNVDLNKILIIMKSVLTNLWEYRSIHFRYNSPFNYWKYWIYYSIYLLNKSKSSLHCVHVCVYVCVYVCTCACVRVCVVPLVSRDSIFCYYSRFSFILLDTFPAGS